MIEQIRETIRHELFYAQASRDFWWRCVGENERREKTLEVLNNHVGFFGIAVQQFSESYVISILRLYDADKGSVTLKYFYQKLKTINSSHFLDVGKMNSLFASAEQISEKLKLIRNKHIAHRSKQVFRRDFYKEAGLTHDQMKELWDLSWEIFCALSYSFDRSYETLLQDNVDAFDFMIDGLSDR